jgi:hypothetical protein
VHAWTNTQAPSCPSCGKRFVYRIDKPDSVAGHTEKNPLPEIAALLESISTIEHAKVELIIPAEPLEFIVPTKQ